VKGAAAPKGDPVGRPLLAKHKSKTFYEHDVAPRKRRTQKALGVGHKEETSEWVAWSAPVERSEGVWEIPAIHLVDGSSSGLMVVKDKACENHVLAGVSDPTNVLHGDCVDTYIAACLRRDSDKAAPPEKKERKQQQQ
jgi:hypothetical protein